MRGWLTPARRKWLHMLIPLIGAFIVEIGLCTQAHMVLIVGVAVALLDLVVALVFATGGRQAVYGLATAFAVALVGFGWVKQNQVDAALAMVPAVLGSIFGYVNTDITTDNGQPREELRMRGEA